MRLLPDSNLVRAAAASFWSYSGRVVGLAWTVVMIHTLGIGDYGRYAMGFAAAALLNALLDNAFHVRSLRVGEQEFERERCARVLFGVVLAVLGVLVYPQWYIAGFAVIVAAGELLFNTLKSSYLRAGRPDITMRFDAIRQVAGIVLGSSYLVLADAPRIEISSALYLLPYAVILALDLRYCPGRRPAFPGGLRECTLLSAEAFAAAVYAQGDVLIIGAVAGTEVAGYYSVALITALAIASIGQNYANTFVHSLRAAAGDLRSAPPLRHTARVALGTGAVMAAVGVGILLWGGADDVGIVSIILSCFVFARSMNYVFTMVLSLQRRDWLRVRTTAGIAIVKVLGMVALAASFGGYGAAVASVLCEFTILFIYWHAIYRQPPPTARHRKSSRQTEVAI